MAATSPPVKYRFISAGVPRNATPPDVPSFSFTERTERTERTFAAASDVQGNRAPTADQAGAVWGSLPRTGRGASTITRWHRMSAGGE